ncbi:hypothetical protein N7478_000112 [Penicillium angulare]|uniref:uncharacterized protein n=1 Tax=Penicillium angulare TaxID=116970 RepID=UPI00254214EE|nr:uncharacterized protein N7478_000112 [Penicillium angulare]KAJ5290861.1 hypothetical protein N7478_000112 [Penicillium angulare]
MHLLQTAACLTKQPPKEFLPSTGKDGRKIECRYLCYTSEDVDVPDGLSGQGSWGGGGSKKKTWGSGDNGDGEKTWTGGNDKSGTAVATIKASGLDVGVSGQKPCSGRGRGSDGDDRKTLSGTNDPGRAKSPLDQIMGG